MSSDLISAQHQSDEVKVNTSTTNAVALVTVQLPSERLEIVHVTNGRVRIRATEGISNSQIKNISQALQQYGVTEVAANQQTGSITITFDEKKLLFSQVLGLLQQFNIHQAQVSPTSNSKTDPFAAWKSLDFWKEQSISFIPLMTGLAVTGGLGISGLAAIPVYMIAADATRWVIDSLEPKVSRSPNNKTSATVSDKKSSDTPSSVESKKTRKSLLSKDESKSVIVNKSSDLTTEPEKIAYSVVHAIAGRIRFHLPRLAQDRAYGRRLERLIKNDPQTISVRVNSGAASIAIAYKPSQISVAHWVNLMELALQTNPPSDPITAIEPQTSLEEVSQTTEVDTTTVLEGTTLDMSQTAEVDNTTSSEDTTLEMSQTTEVNNTTSSKNTNLDLSSLWADLKPATMSYSLAFMANFPL